MFSGLLSATAWYADVAVAVFLALFLVGGLIKGFAKSTKGFFAFVFIVCASLLLMGLTQEKVTESKLGTSISDALASASADWGPAFNTPVEFGEDGAAYVIINGESVSLKDGDFGIKGSVANFFATRFMDGESGQTVASAAVGSITSLCVSAIMFVVFVIGISLLFAVLRLLVRPLTATNVLGLKALDKILGIIFSVFVGLVFVWIVFAIFAAIGDKMAVVNDALRDSAFAGLLFEHNPIAAVFHKILGW